MLTGEVGVAEGGEGKGEGKSVRLGKGSEEDERDEVVTCHPDFFNIWQCQSVQTPKK